MDAKYLYWSAFKNGLLGVLLFALGEIASKLYMGDAWTTSGGIVGGTVFTGLGTLLLNIRHLPSRAEWGKSLTKHTRLATAAVATMGAATVACVQILGQKRDLSGLVFLFLVFAALALTYNQASELEECVGGRTIMRALALQFGITFAVMSISLFLG